MITSIIVPPRIKKKEGKTRGGGKFTPKVTALLQKDGSLCGSAQVASTFADYLEDEVFEEPTFDFAPPPPANTTNTASAQPPDTPTELLKNKGIDPLQEKDARRHHPHV